VSWATVKAGGPGDSPGWGPGAAHTPWGQQPPSRLGRARRGSTRYSHRQRPGSLALAGLAAGAEREGHGNEDGRAAAKGERL
jgi:hypothetical protein